MMCEYAGVEYENKMCNDFAVWGAEKADLKKIDPMINLPYVKDGDKIISQSNNCFFYLAKKLNLAGKLDEYDECKMLAYFFEVTDIRNSIIELVYPFKTVCRTKEEHTEKTKAFCETGVKASFSKLEDVLERSSGPFLMGEHISGPDFHLWEMIDQLELMSTSVSSPSPIAEFPKLSAFYAHFRALPQLESYFSSGLAKLPVNNALGGAYFL